MSEGKRTTETKICKECQEEFSAYGLSAHIKYSHEMGVDEYVKKYGEFRKSKLSESEEPKRETQQIKCGECGNEYSSVGIHTHLRQTHNMSVEDYVEKHGEYRKKQKERERRKKKSKYECQICNEKLVSDRQLSFHVRKEHSLSKEDYVLEYIFGGEHPTCECGCGDKVEILSYEPYKRDYVSGHNSKGKNNPMYGRSHRADTKKLMKRRKFDSLLERLENSGVKPFFKFKDYEGVEYHEPYTKYKFQCDNCGSEFESDLRRSRIPSCPDCVNNGISNQHLQVKRFLNSLGVEFQENNRKIIGNYLELDFYLPDYDLAIEFDGIYWHSENAGGKSRTYHLKKTEKCEEQGIHLIHIFEDEWAEDAEIVKSRIKYILGMHDGERVYARNCVVREIDPSLKNSFLEEHHIQGEDRSSLKYGMFYNGTLVSVMTFSKPRAFQSAEYNDQTWEISRFVTNKDYVVVGAFGKLFKHFQRNENPESVISYADRRYTYKLSNVYKNHGFDLESDGTPNYWYTDFIERKHRFNFTKSRIVEKYGGDPDLTEWENMKKMGYDRIWDCGHLKYVWKNNNH